MSRTLRILIQQEKYRVGVTLTASFNLSFSIFILMWCDTNIINDEIFKMSLFFHNFLKSLQMSMNNSLTCHELKVITAYVKILYYNNFIILPFIMVWQLLSEKFIIKKSIINIFNQFNVLVFLLVNHTCTIYKNN